MASLNTVGSGGDFHKVALTNAQNVGLNRQVKKTDSELKAEDNDKVSISGSEEVPAEEGAEECSEEGTETPQQPVPTPVLTGNPYIDNLIQSGKISKEQLQQLLDLDKARGEEEQMVINYNNKSREDMKNTYLNSWVEAKNAEKERQKTFLALVDSMNKIDAAIAANRMATQVSINASWYKMFFG
jgi:hypothetical protein